MKYKSVIFDLDGTLLESSAKDLSWLHKAVQDVLDNHNCEEDFSSSELEILAGLHSKKEFTTKCESINIDPETFWDSLCEARAERKLKFIENGGISLYDDAEDLLKCLKQNNIRTGLVSNSPDNSVNAIVQYYGLDKYLHYYRGVTNLEDLGREKPDPWHIEIAMDELKRKPYVYIGDAETDVKAAENAEIDSIRVSKDAGLSRLKDKIGLS